MMAYTYLALGDSYTIGEQVLLSESFPYQTVQLLRNAGFLFNAAEIIAKTGWTTDELAEEIHKTSFLKSYDLVSLLIGVNNQYRGRTTENFENEFNQLLRQAICFAGDDAKKVFVLSIPDWGVTPFAADREIQKIANEIDAYNEICKKISGKNGCNFIDITAAQRMDSVKENYLATDQLHPSGLEYAKWAKQLSEAVKDKLK
jgi:lysophospholipase L1-like esterase